VSALSDGTTTDAAGGAEVVVDGAASVGALDAVLAGGTVGAMEVAGWFDAVAPPHAAITAARVRPEPRRIAARRELNMVVWIPRDSGEGDLGVAGPFGRPHPT
jgi:hypothetical protein